MSHAAREDRGGARRCVSLGATLGAFVVLAATHAGAVDGVIEISHAEALAGGITAGDTPGYPVTLSEPGSYRLTTDLEIPSTTGLRGVVVSTGPVTLDLNGFAIRGPGDCSGIPPSCSGHLATVGVEVTSSEIVRLRGGTITGAFTAVYVPTTSVERSLDLDDMALVENGGTAMILAGPGASVVRNSRVDRNGIDGIDIPVVHTVQISNTTFRSNGNYAVYSEGSASLVQDSHFIGNGSGIRSFFIGAPSAALVYESCMFSANGTDVTGGFALGESYCSGSLCP
ncbi:MAG TPA: right-handed parallel beta-helix repeat-containing protein [Myxococcota bacterium]|nr:right-handed parallel beta-helix repeat-containing protein [Myxococcota bacterium]